MFQNKTALQRVVVAVIVVTMLVVMLPTMTKASVSNERFGYTKLSSEKAKTAYKLIVAAVERGDDSLSLSGKSIYQSDVISACEMIVLDYPEFFWFQGTSGGVVDQNNAFITLNLRYIFNGETVSGKSSVLKTARDALNKEVNKILAGMPKGDDYQKALYLHDCVVNAVTYSDRLNNHQTAYGALVEKEAVCAGYSHAYQLLLRKADIDSLYITGWSKGIPHAWLLVWLDGDCYYTDVTWDDMDDSKQPLGAFHYYFNMSYDDISADHVADSKYVDWLPSKHDHTNLYYFEKETSKVNGIGWFNKNTAPRTLCEYLRKEGNQYVCDFRFDGTDAEFTAWFANAVESVFSEIPNAKNATYLRMGNEYMLSISLGTHTHSMTKVTAKAATCQQTGNKAYYICSSCGSYYEDANGTTLITDKSSVIIARRTHAASGWKSDAEKHWKECTYADCKIVLQETSASHIDGNGDGRCDTCNYQMPEETTPPITTDPNETTVPPTQGEEPTQGSTTPTEGNTTPTEGSTTPTEGNTTPTEGSTPPTEGDTPSDPSTPAADETTPDGSEPSQNSEPPTSGGSGTENQSPVDPMILIVAAGVVGVLAVVMIIISALRKKRHS